MDEPPRTPDGGRYPASAFRWLLIAAALVLAATGILHLTGFSTVAALVNGSGIPADQAPVFKGLWLIFSIHLFLLALLVFVMVLRGASVPLLSIITLFPIADTILLLLAVGIFPGSIMLAAVCALMVAAVAVRTPRRS